MQNLSKDAILKMVSPSDIYLKFLGISSFPKGNISSPFSKDQTPSFKLYKNGTFKCFSSGKQGDVFQFVADLLNLSCKTQFNEVLQNVATTLQLHNQSIIGVETTRNLNNNLKNSHLKNLNPLLQQCSNEGATKVQQETEPFEISVSTKNMKNEHIKYWTKLGVGIELLQKYKVGTVSNYSFYSSKKEKDINYRIAEGVLCFSYQVNGRFEIYIPEQPEKNKKKFFCNSLQKNDIFGLNQLDNKSENLIICAGKKDTLVATSRGFQAITFRSENHLPTKDQIKHLQQCCNNLFICYDNDKGGISGKSKILDLYPNINEVKLPEEINDLSDYFQKFHKEDFQTLIENSLNSNIKNSKNEKLTTIFHLTEDYLLKNYDLRNNTISLDIEISKKNKNQFVSCNENSLWLELQKNSIKIPFNSLMAILKSDFVTPYNPLKNYFENLPKWDGKTDYIKQFSEYVILDENEDQEQFEYHFKKWCVRAVKCATIDNYFNKQAFVLTDDGIGQNIGKSSWCRYLCPPNLSKYLAEDMSDDKDARILLCKNFLINLDELAALSRKEVNQLKSYFSKSQINERLPYNRKNSIIQRVASFIGSTNMTTFLQDETGSVRWLCFVIKNINWEYKGNFDINNLWTHAKTLANDPAFEESMTLSDIQDNEERNIKFQIISPEQDMIIKFFAKPKNNDNDEFMSPTEMLNYVGLHTSLKLRLSNVGIGKALKSLGYNRSKKDGVYGYWVQKKST